MKMELSTILTIVLIGVVAGMFSGFIGIGGGLIVVPALVFFMGFTQHQAQGTSLAMMLPPIGLLAVMNYYKSGHITTMDLKVALILATTFILGSYFGSKFAIALSADVVKKAFGIIIILVGIKMILNK
jgi:uncharacterized membrane protein YfcA